MRGAEGTQVALTTQILPIFQALTDLIRQGIDRGQLRPDLNPMLAVFFFVRLEFEILDLIPVMAQRLCTLDPDEALPLAERTWFEVFWRGVAVHPEEALPFLNHEVQS